MNHTASVNSPTECEPFSLFQHLPNELKYYIFSHFDHIALVCAAPVCSDWHTLANEDKFWLNLHQSRWPQDDIKTPLITHKAAYIQQYQLWKLYKPFADTGEIELSRAFSEDVYNSTEWSKVYLYVQMIKLSPNLSHR